MAAAAAAGAAAACCAHSLQHRRGNKGVAPLDPKAGELPDHQLCVGDIFLQFARLFKLYGEYASHHEAASQALDELEQKSPRCGRRGEKGGGH